MDWIQTFVILGVFIGGFFYLAAKIDEVRKDLDEVRKELSKEIKKIEQDILWIKFQHGHNPDKEEAPKEG